MKLRLTATSIRLRLGPDDVDHLIRTGTVAHAVTFAPGQSLTFELTVGPHPAVRAAFAAGRVRVDLPDAVARRWAASPDEVSIRGDQPVPGRPPLSVLIEKDFECLHGEQDGPAFPNPVRQP